MGSLLPVYVYIFISKDGATHGTYADSLFGHAHFVDYLGHQLVYHTMGATRAVVHIVVVHEARLLIYKILGAYDFFFCHGA